MFAAIEITQPRLSQDLETNLWRLEAEVDGIPVYFQSATPLTESSEAFVCGFFLAASKQGRPLKVAGPVDAVLAENLQSVAKVAKRYWNFDGPSPQMQTIRKDPVKGDTGMFFTCGVDSFCTLKRNAADVRHLINVHGFDIRLKDTDRYNKSRGWLERTAETLGLNLICVETNLRAHPLYRLIDWEAAHGAALAAVGHVLTQSLGTIRIAGSDVPAPWGSSPELDKLWSSSRLTLINNEVGFKRIDKVEEIAHWSLTFGHLNVCWENLADTLNCGFCEKCVRTQTALFAFDALKDSTSFPAGDLAKRIDSLRLVDASLIPQWTDLKNKITAPAEGKAIRRLIRRSMILNPVLNPLRAVKSLVASKVRQRLNGKALTGADG